jgi:hypothetical protein
LVTCCAAVLTLVASVMALSALLGAIVRGRKRDG